MLSKIGFSKIEEADDGMSAWKKIEEAYLAGDPFELILSDSSLENLSGLELLKKIRKDDRFKTLPFLMITSEAEQNHLISAIEAGANSFIVKPFSIETLKQKIEKIF